MSLLVKYELNTHKPQTHELTSHHIIQHYYRKVSINKHDRR